MPHPLRVDMVQETSTSGSWETDCLPLKGIKIGVFWPVRRCFDPHGDHATHFVYAPRCLSPSALSQRARPSSHLPRPTPQWFNDSDPHILSRCRAAVDEAVALGAELVEVAIPDLELMRVAHTVTIGSEMHHCMQVGRGIWSQI